MKPVRVTVCEGGRIVIPAEIRTAPDVKTGDALILALAGNEVHMVTPREAVRE